MSLPDAHVSGGTPVPAYKESAVFSLADRVGSKVSIGLAALFLYLDRVLEASFVGKSLSGVWRLGREWGKGSLFVEKLWLPLIGPMASLAFAPYGVKPGPETIIGISLALACVFPTELVFLAIAGSLSVVLWSRAKERRRTPVDRDFISATGEVTSRFWVFPEFGTTAALTMVFVFLVGATFASALPGASIYNLVIWCFCGLIFFMAADAAARGKGEMVIWPFLTGATFSGLVAVYQKVSGWMPPRSWLDERFEEDIVRYVGTFTNPTFFAEMLGLALPLTAALLLKKRDWRDRLVLLAFLGVQGIGMILSFSRGAWLGLIVSFAIVAVLYERRLLILGLLVGVLALAVAPPVLVDRLMSSFSLEDSSNSYRVFIWRGSFAMLREYLFRGVGLGAEAFSHVYPEFMIVQTPAPHAHSVYVQMLLEIGLFGFLAFAWFFVVWTLRVLSVLFREKGGWTERWLEIGVLAGAFAAIAGQMLQGVIEHTWYNPRVTLVFWAVMGMSSGIVLRKQQKTGGAGE